MITLGVIADDFTGATDIASFLVQNGLSTVQLNGVPTADYQVQAQAVVISLKSRSCPVQQAIDDSLSALSWLQAQHCQQFYFKYCSTFDSTANGNIGPVTDALLDALGESMTVISPALPVNGRTVYQGHLFVMDQLLSDSGMRHHPVTPMTDSSLLQLMERQACGRCGLVPYRVMEQGSMAVQQQLTQLREQGCRYAVLDNPKRTAFADAGRGAANDEAGHRWFRDGDRPGARLGRRRLMPGDRGGRAATRPGRGAFRLLLGDDQPTGGVLSPAGGQSGGGCRALSGKRSRVATLRP
ncbi:four-carbon acid sugar kinase family protein [Dickeya ananatis]|uniref:four-carbon acid sugar kinase family protein n=1 Tax=Dickeya ananatis TaxID=3061286 RepID=UPI0038904B00